MKKIFLIGICFLSSVTAFASQTYLGGGVVNRQTGEMIRLGCVDEKCSKVEVILFDNDERNDQSSEGQEIGLVPISVAELPNIENAVVVANRESHRANLGSEIVHSPYTVTKRLGSLIRCVECGSGVGVLLIMPAAVVETALLPVVAGESIAEAIQTHRIHKAFRALKTADKYVTIGRDRFEILRRLLL